MHNTRDEPDTRDKGEVAMASERLTRRSFIGGGLALAAGSGALGAIPLLAACGASSATPAAGDDVQTAYDSFVKKEMPGVSIDLLRAAKKEGALNLYMLVPPFNKPLVEKFQAIFPFITPQLTQLNGGPLVAKFTAEALAGQKGADIVQYSSVADSKKALDQKLIANYKVSVESELAMDAFISGYVIPITGEILVIAYNPTRIKDSDVKSLQRWEGLLDSRWAGKKFAVGEVLAGGTTQLLNYYFFKTFGTKMWQQLSKSYAVYPGGNPELDAVIAGENDIAVGVPGSLAVGRFAKSAPVHWVNAQDFLVTPYVQFVSAKAANPNAAKLFQEFTVSPTGQQLIGQLGGVSYRKGIKAGGDFTKESWYVAPDPKKFWQYSDSELGAAMPDIAKQWRGTFK